MIKRKEIGLDFVVDKLTNSIENVITGDSFATDVLILATQDLASIGKNQVGNSIGQKSICNQSEMFTN